MVDLPLEKGKREHFVCLNRKLGTRGRFFPSRLRNEKYCAADVKLQMINLKFLFFASIPESTLIASPERKNFFFSPSGAVVLLVG